MKSDVEASALVSAAANGHEGIVRQLIKSGANINSGTGVAGGFDFALGGAAEAGHFVSAPLVTVASGKVRLYKDFIGWPKPQL